VRSTVGTETDKAQSWKRHW